MVQKTLTRRKALLATGSALLAPLLSLVRADAAVPRLRVVGVELLPIRATSRTVWLIVRLRTDAGLIGLGEASDAFGFANTTAEDAARMQSQLQTFFALIDGRSPFEIETRIAAMAAEQGVMVAPHNPSGPVSTAASGQVCAGMKNVNYLEPQYGEISWRSDALTPPERFLSGTIQVPDRPGFGVELNEEVIRTRSMPL